MNINETEIMICDCGKTMPLDAKKLGLAVIQRMNLKYLLPCALIKSNILKRPYQLLQTIKKPSLLHVHNKQNFLLILLKKIIKNRHIFLILEKLLVGLKPLKKHLLKYHL